MSELRHDDSGFFENVEDMGRLSIGENEEKAIERGKEFVKYEFPDWEEGCHILPEIFRDREEQDGTRAEWEVMKHIDHLSRNEAKGQPMFVVANIKCLKNDGECDIIIAHRRAGLKILQVKDGKQRNLSENIRNGLEQVTDWEEKIRGFYAANFPGSSNNDIIRGKSGYVCVPFHSLKGTREFRRNEGTLSKDDCESPDAFKTWWRNHILDGNQEFLSPETYLNIISIILGGWCLKREGYRRNLGWLVPMVSNALANPVAFNQIENIPEPGFDPIYLKGLMEGVTYESGKRIMTVKGVAGTGKTWLLVESASNILINESAFINENVGSASDILSDDDANRMLVLCFNKPLAKFLQWAIMDVINKKMNNLRQTTRQPVVKTFDAFMGLWSDEIQEIHGFALRQRKPLTDDEKKKDLEAKIRDEMWISQNTFRHIFVDEGIDLCRYNSKSRSGRSVSWIELLENIWDKKGTFFLTFDEEQKVYYEQNITEKERDYLSKAKKLKTNIRSPRHICESFLAHLNEGVREEVKMGHKIDGYPVKWQEPYLPVEPEEKRLEQGAKNVWKIISDCSSEKYDKEFVILTRNATHTKQVRNQLKKTRHGEIYSMRNAEGEEKESVDVEDKESYDNEGKRKKEKKRKVLIVDSFRRFKGLEASIIILFDLPADDDVGMYVGKSRSTCLLFILGTKDDHKKIMEKEKDHTEELLGKKRKGKAPESAPSRKSQKRDTSNVHSAGTA